MRQRVTPILILLALAFACCAAFVGCGSGGQAASTEEQKANSKYMLQANEIMDEFKGSLSLFNDAVSRGDVVNMRTQADNAYKSLDKLQKAEAPEALSEIKKNYVDGTSKLREALDAYIALYTKVSGSESDIEKSSYNDEIARIQKLYDEGISALQKGDELAANPGGESTSSAALSPSSEAASSEPAYSSSITPPSGPAA